MLYVETHANEALTTQALWLKGGHDGTQRLCKDTMTDCLWLVRTATQSRPHILFVIGETPECYSFCRP